MLGTFLTIVVQPDVTFQHGTPLLLTTHGEFVIKKLVLLAAGLVVAASLRRLRPRGGATAREPSPVGRSGD